MTGPIMAVGKNLSGIGILRDRQQLITKLYPRGSGSTPSELTLDNPGYWPAGQLLELNRTDGGYAYFRLPTVNGFECSSYYGDNTPTPSNSGYGDGWDLNSSFCVGKNLNTGVCNSAWDGHPLTPKLTGAEIASPSDAVALVFYNWGSGIYQRIYDVSFFLQRNIDSSVGPTQWTTQPRFVVGLYSTQNTTSIPGFQTVGYHIPHQGPLCWCYGNLLSISTTPTWYSFPMQAAAYPTGWYAIVVAPYPTSNKQWSVNDYLALASSPTVTDGCYAEQCRFTGMGQKNGKNKSRNRKNNNK